MEAYSRPDWIAALYVDQDDPFFFDHPLDHVPGMLIVSGLLDLARDAIADPLSGKRIRMSLNFPRFCELDDKTTLHCALSDHDRWVLLAEQAGRPVCEGTLTLRTDDGEVLPVPAVKPYLRRADGELVHRVHSHNVMIGQAEQVSPGLFQAAVLPSAVFPHSGKEFWAVHEIIEAARELSIMLGHLAHDRAKDDQVLWLLLEIDLPWDLPKELPLMLCWQHTAPDRARSRFALELKTPGVERLLGTVSCVSHTMTSEAYARKRGQR